MRVRLLLRDEPDALMAPVAALGSNQMGKFVYVVGDGDKAELRPLELGPGDGALVSVIEGPQRRRPGDRRQLAEDRPGLAGEGAAGRDEAGAVASPSSACGGGPGWGETPPRFQDVAAPTLPFPRSGGGNRRGRFN